MRNTALWIGLGIIGVVYLLWAARPAGGPPASVLGSRPAPSPVATLAAASTSDGARAAPTAASAAAPALLLGAGRVRRRSVVVAAGLGFAPGERLRLIREDPFGRPTILAAGRADKHGEFSGLVVHVADAWPNGFQTIVAEGLSSHRRASARFDLEGGPPGAEPTTYAAKPLSPVGFHGGGFAPGEVVDLYFDSLASPVLGSATTNQIGSLQLRGPRVPMAAPGQHAFLLVGRQSRAPVRIPFSVLAFSPWLGLSSYTPLPGQPIAVTGHDFAPGERVALFVDTLHGSPVSRATADSAGSFRQKAALVIPYDRRGRLTIVGVGEASQATASVTLAIMPLRPWLGPVPAAGPARGQLSFDGGGFAPGEVVRISVATRGSGLVSSDVAATEVRSDARGDFQHAGSLRVPQGAAERLSLTAIGTRSGAEASATYTVLPRPEPRPTGRTR